MVAARHGANVRTCESNAEIAAVARKVVAANHDVISQARQRGGGGITVLGEDCLHMNMTHPGAMTAATSDEGRSPSHPPPKADVVVTETMSNDVTCGYMQVSGASGNYAEIAFNLRVITFPFIPCYLYTYAIQIASDSDSDSDSGSDSEVR
jgi:hypothetical protein